MMNDEIYEVTRDEYVDFLYSIEPTARLTETEKNEGYTSIKVMSNKNGTIYCKRIIPPQEKEDESEKYFIYNDPPEDDRRPIKPRLKLTLETPEEVKAFAAALSKLQKR